MYRLRPKKILWPTDFSELSLIGGQCACDLCGQFGAELHVVHVCHPPLAPHIEALLPAEAAASLSDTELLRATADYLEQVVAEQFQTDIPVVCQPLVGHPSSQICAYAGRTGIGLIVIATHGLTGLRHVLIGSTVERVVQHAPCPVLTMKSFARRSAGA